MFRGDVVRAREEFADSRFQLLLYIIEYASAEERAAKKPKRPSADWFYGERIRTSVHGSHNVIVPS